MKFIKNFKYFRFNKSNLLEMFSNDQSEVKCKLNEKFFIVLPYWSLSKYICLTFVFCLLLLLLLTFLRSSYEQKYFKQAMRKRLKSSDFILNQSSDLQVVLTQTAVLFCLRKSKIFPTNCLMLAKESTYLISEY